MGSSAVFPIIPSIMRTSNEQRSRFNNEGETTLDGISSSSNNEIKSIAHFQQVSKPCKKLSSHSKNYEENVDHHHQMHQGTSYKRWWYVIIYAGHYNNLA